MSFGWSAGDLLCSATLVWSVYQCLSDGPRIARSEASLFAQEFELVLKSLGKLSELEQDFPRKFGLEEERDPTREAGLGQAYQQTLQKCKQFVDRHELLTKKLISEHPPSPGLPTTTSRRLSAPSIKDRIRLIYQQATWPAERKEVETLRRSLERYIQIAIFKTPMIHTKQNRHLVQSSKETRLDNLKILQAIKVLSYQVLFLLKRSVPKSGDAENQLDYQYIDQLQQRALPKLIEPNRESLFKPWADRLDESSRRVALLSASTSNQDTEPIRQIRELSQKLEYLMMRQNPGSMSHTRGLASVGRADTMNISSTQSAKSVNSVMEFLERIRHHIGTALGYVGFEPNSVPGEVRLNNRYYQVEQPSKTLTSAIEEWEQLSKWIMYQLIHSEAQTGPPSAPATPPSPPSPLMRPESNFSSLFRTPSDELHLSTSPRPYLSSATSQMIDRNSSSTLSSVYLGIPWDFARATTEVVKVIIPDSRGHPLHSTMQCSVDVVSHPISGEIISIVSLGEDRPGTVRHTIQQITSPTSESSMIPHLDNMHVYHGQDRYRLHFCGSHKIEVEENSEVATHITQPIYVCQNKEDYLSFQNKLLKKDVQFIADVVQIVANGDEHLCNLETVRVLQEPGTLFRSVLFYATSRGTNNLAGFEELPVSSFKTKTKGSKALELKLNRAALERPSTKGIVSTSGSQESQSTAFGMLEGPLDSLKFKKLTFEFYDTTDRDDFKKWFDIRPPYDDVQ